MLLKLYIRNFAIIDALEIPFASHLNVITGETGAGKSILLGALSLILGERADKDVLRDQKNKAVVEGVFLVPDAPAAKTFFAAHELEYETETIIRREIHPQGKSRAFVNDTPVTLQQLSRLGALLVDLHQQFDTLELQNADFQLEVLDALAGHGPLAERYRQAFSRYREKKKEHDELKRRLEESGREQDYDQFLYDELEKASFSPDELELLEQEQRSLTHAEDLRTALEGASSLLEEDEAAAVSLVRAAESKLQAVSAFHPGVAALCERLSSALIELRDIAAELQQLSGNVSFDAERISFITQRLDAGYRLLKKHGVQTTRELLEIRDTLARKLDAALHGDETLRRLESEVASLEKEAESLAAAMGAGRRSQTAGLVKRTNALLRTVGMPGASLRIDITENELRETGRDTVTFLFDANKTGAYQPIRKVASGGELSRLMLCIKSLVARSVSMPTLIFDEIDSGISGEAARQVGNILKDLAATHQVICITHQPQIAGKADTHLEVFKQEAAGRVTTGIRTLSHEERVETIARMLSGEKPGEAAMANARELMEG